MGILETICMEPLNEGNRFSSGICLEANAWWCGGEQAKKLLRCLTK